MFKNILFAIDINDEKSWKISIPKVIDICSKSTDSNLTIINVVQTYGLGMMEEYFPKNWDKEVTKKSLEKLQEIITQNLPAEIKCHVIVDKGVIYQAIIDRAEKLKADLIILTAQNSNKSDYLLGPNAAKVVRHSTKSVLVIRV